MEQAKTAPPLELPPPIPGYALLDKVGEGGMGEVHRATQLSLQRTVAVKFMNPLATGLGARSTDHRESRLMAALGHPNVVTVYDCGEAHGRDYLVMEYVDGPTLRARMEPGNPWPVAEAGAALGEVAQALAYIHDQGILHLDLKPENVLCTKDGTLKITDFGLAAAHVDVRTLSDLGLAGGTVDYCSPEQQHALPLDQRSDVFSLAAIAYELLTGRVPSRVFRPATGLNPLLPRALDAVLGRGLARHPEERYASVVEFSRALNRALGLEKSAAGRRLLVLAGGTLAVAWLGALLLTWTGLAGGEGPARDLTGPLAGNNAAWWRSAPFGGKAELLYPSNRTGSTNLFRLRPAGGLPVRLDG
jgi:serine/threonine protein kinase